MPLYDYVCSACGRRFEVIHGLNESGPTSCPLCGKGPVRKVFAAPAIHFKGSGWAKKERRAGKTGSGSGSSKRDDSSDTTTTSGSNSDTSTGSSAGKGGSSSGSSDAPSKSDSSTPSGD